jgi:hypothetical protein
MDMVRSFASNRTAFDAIQKIVGRSIRFCTECNLENRIKTTQIFIDELTLDEFRPSSLDMVLIESVKREREVKGGSPYVFHCFPIRRNLTDFSAMPFHPGHFGAVEIRSSSDHCACQILECLMNLTFWDVSRLVDVLQ